MSDQSHPSVIIVHDRAFLGLGIGLAAGWLLGVYSRNSKLTAGDSNAAGVAKSAGGVFRKSIPTAGKPIDELIGLQQLAQTQQKIDASMREGYLNTSNKAQDSQEPALYDKASEILQVGRAIDDDFANKATGLVSNDIEALNGLADDLGARAQEIPHATNVLNAANNFLGTANKVLGVFK